MSLTGRPVPASASSSDAQSLSSRSTSKAQPMAVPSGRGAHAGAGAGGFAFPSSSSSFGGPAGSGGSGGLGLMDGSGSGPTSPPHVAGSNAFGTSPLPPLRSPLGSSPPGSFTAGFLGAAAAAGASSQQLQAGTAAAGGGGGVVGQKNARGEGLLRRLSLGAAGAFRPNFRSPVTPSATLGDSSTSSILDASGSPSSLSSSVGGASSIDYPATPMPTPIKSPAIYAIPFTNPFKDDAIHEHHDEEYHGVRPEASAPAAAGGGGGGYFSGAARSPPAQERGKLSWPGAGFWSSTLSAASSALDEGHHAASNLHSSVQQQHDATHHHHHRVASTPAGIPAPNGNGNGGSDSLKPTLSADLTPEAGAAVAAARGRRRFSENQGNKKRGVSPMGEHILRGGTGMF